MMILHTHPVPGVKMPTPGCPMAPRPEELRLGNHPRPHSKERAPVVIE
jgi:hypothetical protein